MFVRVCVCAWLVTSGCERAGVCIYVCVLCVRVCVCVCVCMYARLATSGYKWAGVCMCVCVRVCPRAKIHFAHRGATGPLNKNKNKNKL